MRHRYQQNSNQIRNVVDTAGAAGGSGLVNLAQVVQNLHEAVGSAHGQLRADMEEFVQRTISNVMQLKANIEIAVQNLMGQQQHLRTTLSAELVSQWNQSTSPLVQHTEQRVIAQSTVFT